MRIGARIHDTAAHTRENARKLDVDVAIRLMGYRWVEWNHPMLGGAPIDEPGSFLAARDHPLSHLYMPADPATVPHTDAFARVPRFSTVLDEAFSVAEAAGLFIEGGAALTCSAGGWLLEIRRDGRRFEGRVLASVLCRAALEWRRISDPPIDPR